MTSDGSARTVTFADPVNLSLTLSLLRRGRGDPTHRVVGGVRWRTSLTDDGPVTLALAQLGARSIRAQAWGPGAERALEQVPTLLGADDDPSSFEPRIPLLADAHRRCAGLRVPRTQRLMEALIPAIIEQKVLGIDAFAAWRRLLTRFGTEAPGPAPTGMRVFPPPAIWASIPSWEWHLAGVGPERARAARAAARVGDRLERLAAASAEPAPVYRAMRSVPGVGVWTAAEVGGRALGDADAVSFGDYHLGTRVGLPLGGRPLTDPEVAEVLEPWRPHRWRVVRLLELSPYARVERRGPRAARVDNRRI